MSRSPFGWSYPAGAEHDPAAPYNQTDSPECPHCGSHDTVLDSADSTYEDWACYECESTWYVQVGPDPDDARDAARDDAMTGD